MHPKTIRELAEQAYARYGAATDFKNFRGDPMPAFADLGEKIQKAWEAAGSFDSATPVPDPADHVAVTKQFRKDLDEILQWLKRAGDNQFTGERAPDYPVRSSRERSLAITKIEEAIMWLGMDLKAQNTPNPYPNSYNPASPVIDPTADGLKL